MIRRIQPKVDYKEIKNNAYLAVSLLKDNGPKSELADMAYRRFLKEGKKAPGYASTIMKTAKNDVFLKDTKDMLDTKITPDLYRERSQRLSDGLSNLNTKYHKEKQEFENSGKKMYPKTWDIRKNILNWYRDDKEARYPSSQFKDLKRDFWGTMEKINPEIKRIRSL